MRELERRIDAFVKLGKFLGQLGEGPSDDVKEDDLMQKFGEKAESVIKLAYHHNGWFTQENVRSSFTAFSAALGKQKLEKWVGNYPGLSNEPASAKRVGVVMAGNIPMVGFHDMLCVLLSGNTCVGKLSSDDRLLLPFIAEVLIDIEPALKERIEFTPGQFRNIDAVIATGSNNTSRYFEYYFGKYPNIIRRNRSSVAVITGNEQEEELQKLGEDIFRYFGLGCRNVSKIFVPREFDFDRLFKALYEYKEVVNNKKYGNNYDYNKTVYLLNDEKLLENGFLLLKEDISLSSPVATLFYEYYNSERELLERLGTDMPHIQCIVSRNKDIPGALDPGTTQTPELWDYADRVDTMKFLLELN